MIGSSFWPPRPPDSATTWLLAGVGFWVWRFLGPALFHVAPDDGFIGFGIACFGLWQGEEKRKRRRRDQPQDNDAEDSPPPPRPSESQTSSSKTAHRRVGGRLGRKPDDQEPKA